MQDNANLSDNHIWTVISKAVRVGDLTFLENIEFLSSTHMGQIYRDGYYEKNW